ncbi:MAG TPA: Gfo/Idh/MocA family oxidoreductase [Phycisphaerae bacterium]|nr:Gfo/Idh/MocA family oxidoreductase [Phycisphaerae bacterium]
MSPVRIGLIGAGTWGTTHLIAYSQLARQGLCELVALADLKPDVRKRQGETFGLRTYADADRMLRNEELDAVAVATPDALHLEPALAVLEARKHLLLQKPMDITLDGCDRILATAEKADVLLAIDFHKRCDPDLIFARQQIHTGQLGRVLYGHCYIENTTNIAVPSPRGPQYTLAWAAESSPAWFIGVHKYDAVRWVLGQRFVRVYAHAAKHKLTAMGVDTFDHIQAMVEFSDGATVCFDAGWTLPPTNPSGVEQGLRLVGTDGFIQLEGQYRGVAMVASEQVVVPNTHGRRVVTDHLGRNTEQGFTIESIQRFVYGVAHLKTGGAQDDLVGSFATGRDGRASTALVLAMLESLHTGQPADVDDPG